MEAGTARGQSPQYESVGDTSLILFADLDIRLSELLLRHLRRRAEQEILRGAVQREGDDSADGLGIGEQHDHTCAEALLENEPAAKALIKAGFRITGIKLEGAIIFEYRKGENDEE